MHAKAVAEWEAANAAIQAQNEAATAAALAKSTPRTSLYPRRRARSRPRNGGSDRRTAERERAAVAERPEKGRVTAAEARRSRRPAAPTSADVLAAEPRAGSNLAVTAEGRALQPAWTAAWGEPRWTVNDVPAGDLEDGEVPRVATGVGPGYGGGGGGSGGGEAGYLSEGEVAAAPGGMWQPLPAVVAEAARDVAQQLASSAAGASASASEAAASPAAVAMCARAILRTAIRRDSAHGLPRASLSHYPSAAPPRLAAIRPLTRRT